MKELLVYTSLDKKFDPESAIMIKIQIDSSLDLGWNIEDILLVTNFDYEYRGVKAVVVGDEHFLPTKIRSINTAIIPCLYDMEIMKPDILYWNHDIDAYPMAKITDEELGLEGYDIGLTDYGWMDRWCLGSYFVKHTSRDIFDKIREILLTSTLNDEDAMMELYKDPEIAKRCKRLNVTYNFGMRNVFHNYQIAEKPIRVVHFHPYSRGRDTLKKFMYGGGGLSGPIMSESLIKIFNNHGIK